MNLISLKTVDETKDSTLGVIDFNGKKYCFSLEDAHRRVKVLGETRIPRNILCRVELRTAGRLHKKYLNRFGPDFHKGMLWLRGVPNYKYVYIHIGNKIEDTLGCILTGTKGLLDSKGNFQVEQSTVAYKKLYADVIPHIGDLWVKIV